jgi:hypothetical protein
MSDRADPRLESGQAWDELCDALRDARALVLGPEVPTSPRHRAEGFRYLTQFLAAGIRTCVSHGDPDQPAFCRMIEPRVAWGLDAPDCLYLWSAIRGGTRYRIGGWRGSANHIDIQVNAGHYASGRIADWETIGSLDGFELECDADGRFELTLGGDEEGANWLPLRDDAGFVLVRQYFDDWERERPADLWIEREGGEGPAPPPQSSEIADRLERLREWLVSGGALWEQMSKGFLAMEANTLLVHVPENAGERTGMAGQAYGIGNFRCAPDEAVIVEFAVPPCHHWSVSLATWFWESIDFTTRQSSLNGAQATLGESARFVGVIAHDDPGVANWLDPAGHTQGSIAARFLRAGAAPSPKLTAVPRSELERALPPGVPRCTPEARASLLARRRRAAVARYRW